MPASKNIAAYTDCHTAFETAIARDGLIVTFDTPGKARNFSQRCYSYRKLLHTQQAATAPAGTVTATPYDEWKIKLEGLTLTFVKHSAAALQFSTLDGEPIENTTVPIDRPLAMPDPENLRDQRDELLEDAFDIAAQIRKSGGLNFE